MKRHQANLLRIGLPDSIIFTLILNAFAQKSPTPLKIVILAGQSNMVGHGEIEKGGRGNLNYLVENDDKGEYQHLVNEHGEWKMREDVFIYFNNAEKIHSGRLTVGFGANENTIGPELQFGHVIGDHFDEDVLLIKTAWGGKSLAVDFFPPGELEHVKPPLVAGDTGYYYVQMISIVNEVLGNLQDHVPSYTGQGYEIAGFGWHQGWNDRINQVANDAYRENMIRFIQEVRKDLGVPTLPFVIATTGMSGWEETHPRALSLMEAQLAVADYPEFMGNVNVVDTRDFWRNVEDSPADQSYHWNRNAASYFLIGKSMGESMIAILEP
ncbi:sialate O-acetylesterase [Lunatimonas salinarum]|uniref:sialate O-acetylesterase n=1 Tax=Lunatimonas salinarum TaxID=1774590 RepID=UPI001AE0D3B3|nr:sialate O-acetylesterase [Lunatimonas salinarum]